MTTPATHQGDIELLTELLTYALRDDERTVFEDMHEYLVSKHSTKLSPKQRAWASKRLEDFRPTYENLVSSGKVSATSNVHVNCGPKVLRPPPRRSEP